MKLYLTSITIPSLYREQNESDHILYLNSITILSLYREQNESDRIWDVFKDYP